MIAEQWLGIIIITVIVGSYAIWWLTDRENARGELQDLFWNEAMQPNRDGDHVAHTPPDTINERPLLPEEYDR